MNEELFENKLNYDMIHIFEWGETMMTSRKYQVPTVQQLHVECNHLNTKVNELYYYTSLTHTNDNATTFMLI